MKSADLLRERNAQRLENNVPLALGELSELFHTKVNIGCSSAIYVTAPSEFIDEKVRQWAQKKGLHVTTFKHYLGNVLCISWGGAHIEMSTIDARFLHNGKLVLRSLFSEA